MEGSSRCICKLLLHVVLLAPLLQARPLGHGRVQVAPLMLPSDGGVVVGGVGRPGGYTPPSPRSPSGPIPLAGDDGPRPSPVPCGPVEPLSDGGAGASGRQWPAPPPPDPNTPVQPLSDGRQPHNPTVAAIPCTGCRPADARGFLLVIRDAVQYMIGGLGP